MINDFRPYILLLEWDTSDQPETARTRNHDQESGRHIGINAIPSFSLHISWSLVVSIHKFQFQKLLLQRSCCQVASSLCPLVVMLFGLLLLKMLKIMEEPSKSRNYIFRLSKSMIDTS